MKAVTARRVALGILTWMGCLCAGACTSMSATGTSTDDDGEHQWSVSIGGEEPDRTIDVEVTPLPKPPTVQVCFMDKDGNATGSTTGSLPILGGSVPPGSTEWELKPAPEDEEEEEGSDRSRYGAPGKVKEARAFFFKGGHCAQRPDPSQAAFAYQMTVWARNIADALAIRDRVKAAIRSRSALPAGVYDIEFASTVQWNGSELALEFADERAFAQLDVELNGVFFAGLGNAAHSVVGTGTNRLHFERVVIPSYELNLGAEQGVTYANDYAVKLRTLGASFASRSEGTWEYRIE